LRNDLFLLFKDKDIFGQFGLQKIGVFGSLARGGHFNDIDLFIEEEINFNKLLRLKKC
jgi:predicted nucleotidyltransferase